MPDSVPSPRLITDFVGQLVHPNVHEAILELALSKDLPEFVPWPPGTVYEEERSDGDGAVVTQRVKVPDGSGATVISAGESASGMNADGERPRYFCRVADDGRVIASEERYGSNKYPKHDLGVLQRPVTKFFRGWTEADAAVQSNESWAIGIWFVDDVIAWCRERSVELGGGREALRVAVCHETWFDRIAEA